jgi:flagellar operon protein
VERLNADIAGLRQTPATREITRQPSTRSIDTLGNKGISFRDQLSALSNQPTTRPAGQPVSAELKFSNHAVDRMRARGIRFSPEQMGKIQNAVGKAESKGARNTLLLTDEAAMIVSVKDKTVVTVMDKAQLKENVFTNIDSTVMV